MRRTLRHAIGIGALLAISMAGCRHQAQISGGHTITHQPGQAGQRQEQAAASGEADIEGMLASGKSQFEYGHFDAAQRIFHRVLDLEPNNQKALYNLGLIARRIWLNTHPGENLESTVPGRLPVPEAYPLERLEREKLKAESGKLKAESKRP